MVSGEAKRVSRVAAGKPSAPHLGRGPGGNTPQSLITYPKPVDLGLASAKGGESLLEARNSSDVQFLKMSWVKAQNANLDWVLLVLPEAARRQARGEVGHGVEHYFARLGR